MGQVLQFRQAAPVLAAGMVDLGAFLSRQARRRFYMGMLSTPAFKIAMIVAAKLAESDGVEMPLTLEEAELAVVMHDGLIISRHLAIDPAQFIAACEELHGTFGVDGVVWKGKQAEDITAGGAAARRLVKGGGVVLFSYNWKMAHGVDEDTDYLQKAFIEEDTLIFEAP